MVSSGGSLAERMKAGRLRTRGVIAAQNSVGAFFLPVFFLRGAKDRASGAT